jgi:hypothetical protein
MLTLIVSITSLIVSVIVLIVSIRAYNKAKSLEQKLKDDYWNKGVVGRTINAKVGKNIMGDEQEQDLQLLNSEKQEV